MEMREREEGFTLIELMVVVMIIAILIAIAVPTFLSVRTKAQDRAAQANLRNAFTAGKSIYADGQDYTQATAAALASSEPSLTFVAAGTASASAKSISVDSSAATQIVMASLSASGTCFFIKDVATAGGGTTYNSGTGTCSASAAPSSGWTTSW